MKCRAVFLALAACLLAAPVDAQQVVARLTLEEAIELAREYNPNFLATLNDLGPARWGVRSANASLFLPSANLSFSSQWQDAGFDRVGGATFVQPALLISSYSFSLAYNLNGTTLFQPEAARAQRTAAERRIDDAELQLRNGVTQAYLEVLRLQAQAEQAEREFRRTEEHLRLAEAREQVGAGTRLESMQADVARGQAEVNMVIAFNRARVAKLRLIQALGVVIPADQVQQIELVSEFEIFEPQYNTQMLVNDALIRHPSLIALRADRDAATSSVKVAKASYLPTLSLRASWSGFTREETDAKGRVNRTLTGATASGEDAAQVCGYFNDLYTASGEPLPPEFSNCSGFLLSSSDSVSLAETTRRANDVFPFAFSNQPLTLSAFFSIPIFTGFNRQLQVEQAVTRRNDLDYQVRGLELQITGDVTEASHNLETAYQTVVLQEENVATAREELRLSQERYQLGAGTFLELLDSQTLAAQAEVDRINAIFSFHLSLAALEAAAGRTLDLPGGE
jgi:outer membrane protein